MVSYTYDDIEDFEFSDSRAYREVVEKSQYVLYRKQLEKVVFNDNQTGYYVSVIREIHEDDEYDSIESETIVKQKIYPENNFKQAETYFLSDRK